MKTVTDKTENKTQWMSVIFLIVSLIAAIYLLYLALPKWIINSPKIYPDGLVVISRTNWSPNPMVKPLHKLSLPVELIIISHTMTKNCTNRVKSVNISLTLFQIQSINVSKLSFSVGLCNNCSIRSSSRT